MGLQLNIAKDSYQKQCRHASALKNHHNQTDVQTLCAALHPGHETQLDLNGIVRHLPQQNVHLLNMGRH